MAYQKFVFRKLTSYHAIKWSGQMKMVFSWNHKVVKTHEAHTLAFFLWQKRGIINFQFIFFCVFRAWKADDQVLLEIRYNEIHYADPSKLWFRRCTSHCMPCGGNCLYVHIWNRVVLYCYVKGQLKEWCIVNLLMMKGYNLGATRRSF